MFVLYATYNTKGRWDKEKAKHHVRVTESAFLSGSIDTRDSDEAAANEDDQFVLGVSRGRLIDTKE